MDKRDELVYIAARRHYVDGATMETIGNELGVSRPTVSRLLARARDTGLVRITLAEPPQADSPTAKELSEHFDIRVHIASVPDSATSKARLREVAKLGAELLTSLVEDESSVGVAWGVTAAQVARELQPVHRSGVRIVQMNGAVHARESGLPYVGSLLRAYAQAFGDAAIIPFPVPAFFDHASTRSAMWRERSIQVVRDEIRSLDVAIFGVGHPNGRIPSHVYTAGYIDLEELADALRHGVVGDVCTVLLRADGSYDRIPLNARATGPTPEEMTSIRRRIAVVGDPSRTVALLAALRSGAITDLVCDQITARNVHRLMLQMDNDSRG